MEETLTYYFEQPLCKAENLPEGGYVLYTPSHKLNTRWVVNCAGPFADKVAEILGTPGYALHLVKGEYIVLDKKAGALFDLPVYPAPDVNMVYDIHVTPTLEGNVLVGPTCDETIPAVDFDTTRPGLNQLLQKGDALVAGIQSGWQIRSFSGVFPKPVDAETGQELDFQIVREKEHKGVVNLIGMTSPGLTSSQAIARHVAELMQETEDFSQNTAFNPFQTRKKMFSECTLKEQMELIENDPNYGEIVCRCENVTRAEILAAIRNPLGRHSVNSIKYRARASMGRCQGGYCETRITTLLQQELGLEKSEIRLAGKDAQMFYGEVK